MNGLTAVRSLTTLPVVTPGGDAVAHVKDTVFDPAAERIAGFTLTGRTLLSGLSGLSGPLPRDLPWPAVHCLGRHAVMVHDEGALCDLPRSVARRDALRGRLLGAHVLADDGDLVGTVLDVLVEGGAGGRLVAFRLAAHREPVHGSRDRRHQVYVPRGEALSVSGRTVVIPAHATTYVTDGLPSFAATATAGGGRPDDAVLTGARAAGPHPGRRGPGRGGARADGRRGVREGHARPDRARAAAQGGRGGPGRPGRGRPGAADRASVRPAGVPPHRDLVGSRVLTECGEARGTVLDAAFDPVTARIEAVLTTLGELPADRLLGLGDHALVVRTGHGHRGEGVPRGRTSRRAGAGGAA
ncbi:MULTISPECIES: hypothetical protein [Streptomyces]|uniref:hypothetical protein n=1 Tax=Streptomyces TaxID=1883 RepID=UPI000AB68127|nr:hypothetical protein [Streptomyces sp. NRRL F-2305]